MLQTLKLTVRENSLRVKTRAAFEPQISSLRYRSTRSGGAVL